MILTFTLPSPPTANNLFFNIQGRGRSRTKEYNDWLERAGWHVKTATLHSDRPEAPYKVTYIVPRSLRGDLANREKAMSDLLVKLGILKDDSLIDKLSMERADREDVLVTVEAA